MSRRLLLAPTSPIRSVSTIRSETWRSGSRIAGTSPIKGAPADGSPWTKGNCSLRGLRGGSFGNNTRFRYDSDVRYEANGFRVLRELR